MDKEIRISEQGNKFKKFMTREKLIPLAIFIPLCILIGAFNSVFFTWQTWQNIMMQVSSVGIIAFGAMFVITSGGLDFTAGEGVSLAGVVAATVFVASGMNNVATIATGIATGAFIGVINGLLITKMKIQPFIATLAMMTIIKGFLLAVSEGTIIHMDVEGATFTEIGQGIIPFEALGPNASGEIQGLPVAFIIFICIAIGVSVVLTRTKFGQATLAMGGNEEASRLVGVKVDWYRFWVYVFAGALTGLGAMLTLARVGSIGVTLGGTTLLMDVVAAAVIGGTAVSGGRCNTFGVVIGTFIVITISSALIYLNVDPNWRDVVKGVIILAALCIDVAAIRASEKMATRRSAMLREMAKRKISVKA